MPASTVPDFLERLKSLPTAVESGAAAFDREGRLPQALVDLMREAGVFHMSVPEDYGGLEADPLTSVAVIEELSRLDGSVGWVAAILGGTAAYSAGQLAPAVAQRLFSDPKALFCGTIAVPSGKAFAIDGGYRVSGRWPFGSGSHHASWFLSACVVEREPAAESGEPEVILALVPSSEVEILDTWHVLGLRGTGSTDYAIHEAVVAEERVIRWGGPPQHPSPLFAAPFFLLAHPAHALGVARHALNAFASLAAAPRRGGALRDQSDVQATYAEAEALVASARCYLHETTQNLWETVTSGEALSLEQRVNARLAMTLGVRNSAHAITLLYEAAGTRGIYESGAIERCYRDIHVAAKHGAVARPSYQDPGQVLLGLEPAGGAIF